MAFKVYSYGDEYKRSHITIGSFQSWVTFLLDISSDVGYYVAIPKRSRLLWILMLITLIAPHVANVFSIARIRYREEDLCDSILFGVMASIYGLLGGHELIYTEHQGTLAIYDVIRSNNALFEDHPQLYLQTFNTLAMGGTFSLLMVVSPVLSIKGILDKFKVDNITKLFGDDWTYEERVKKCWYVMTITFGSLVGFMVAVIGYFYWHSMEYAWHACREAIERPGLLDQESVDVLWTVFYVLAALISLGLSYIGYRCCNNTNKTDDEKRDQLNQPLLEE